MNKYILELEFRTELQAEKAGLLLIKEIPEVRKFTIKDASTRKSE